jgi:hypothetical protein
MIVSNANIVFAKLRANLAYLEKLGTVSDSVTRTLLLSILALIKKRVFEEGKNTSMRGMGGYSKQYQDKIRGANGWSNSNVTLELTGQLRREYILDSDGKNWVIGFLTSTGEKAYSYKYKFDGGRKTKNNPSGTKGTKRITTTTEASGQVARDLEKRYGTVFEMSTPEIVKSNEIFIFESNRRLNG